MALPIVGKLAPEFSLEDQQGISRNLKEFRGKIVVVYFYPKAMTPGCTVQARGLRDSEKELNILGVEVLGISIDAVKRLARFTERDNLNFTLLADEDHVVADKYGVWGLKKFMGREYMGIKRMTFIIDKDGKLNHIMETVKTKTHHEDVLAYIKANLIKS
jgi:thioredoxin-dependent peroxiredoxin